MQGGGIEIGSVRPYKSVRHRINRDSFKHVYVAKRAVQLSAQDGPEVNPLSCPVAESDVQHERTGYGERRDATESVIHSSLVIATVRSSRVPDQLAVTFLPSAAGRTSGGRRVGPPRRLTA